MANIFESLISGRDEIAGIYGIQVRIDIYGAFLNHCLDLQWEQL